MEMKRTISPSASWVRFVLLLGLLLSAAGIRAQEGTKCSVRDNRIYLELRKDLPDHELRMFVERFDLADLDLADFLRRNKQETLLRKGWVIESNTPQKAVLYRELFPAADLQDPADRFHLTRSSFPLPRGNFGVNRFLNKYPFATRDSLVTFFLRGYKNARNVLLSGTFTNWKRGALRMQAVDSGWIVQTSLSPGKYWYKFIVDGGWQIDRDNMLQEGDGEGNVNSVYYRTNHIFRLNGYQQAASVCLAGNFNNWDRQKIRMQRVATGWALDAFIGAGTHLYKYVVDGSWLTDPGNAERLPDGHDGFNSVLRKGNPLRFELKGFPNARKVVVAGTFNNWRKDELYLERTAGGWSLPYVLAPGFYEYKFIVDGKWMADPGNPSNTGGPGLHGNSILVVGANHTFRLKDKPGLQKAFIAGDFNHWNPRSLPMRREGDDWIVSLYLAPGKHRYKFFADGAWLLDPSNKLWEQNEFKTGNSVVWVE